MKTLRKTLFLGLLVFGLVGLGSVSPVSSDPLSCTWTISKCADQNELTLAVGQQFIVNYTLAVGITADSVCVPIQDYADVYDTSWVTGSNPTGYVGSVVYGVDTLPKYFNYSKVIGPFYTCGEYRVDNTATLCTGASSSWTVTVNVPCGGCTLTPGYWKTHSKDGPAPYDDTWAMLPDGEDTFFFLSGQTWYQVMWTAPSGGNAYYILAHAYIAAELNILNGATTIPEVSTALTWAEDFFNLYSPGDVLSKSLRNEAISYASILDNYNKGLIGPGHCTEDNSVSE
jgi:hypothetical protein